MLVQSKASKARFITSNFSSTTSQKALRLTFGALALLYCIGSHVHAYPKLNHRTQPNTPSVIEQGFQNEVKARFWGDEKIPTMSLSQSDDLYKLIALEFLMWVKDNPNGVIALPMGIEGKRFAKELFFYKKHMNSYFVKRELRHLGCPLSEFPKTSGLKIVQTGATISVATDKSKDNFELLGTKILSQWISKLGMQSNKEKTSTINHKSQRNNELLSELSKQQELLNKQFISYIDVVYKDVLEIEPSHIISMGIVGDAFWDNKQTTASLAHHAQLKDALNALHEYDNTIEKLGGIGFYLEVLGDNGEVGYLSNDNLRSSGIIIRDSKPAIGLGAYHFKSNPNTKIIIMAASKSKANPVYLGLRNHPSKINSSNHAQGNILNQFYDQKSSRLYLSSGAQNKIRKERHNKDNLS